MGSSRLSASPASTYGRRRRWLSGGALVAGAVVAALLAFWWQRAPLPLPARSTSPFLNTRSNVAYVGSSTCQSCHADRHASFRATSMGRAMARVEPAVAPPDGAVTHGPSRRRYRVFRRDGQLWHQELLLTPSQDDVVLAEHPLPYVVGSGHHALTYLAEVDGFLVESPVTWYAARKAWDLSPGYDGSRQPGFTRPVGEGCLFCHAGTAQALGRSTHRMTIGEAAIGCERCHGPGALHIERRRSGAVGDAVLDDTIVNPAHLSRELGEAICQQCHLNSDAAVTVRGRKLTDFRPGLPFEEFKEVYVFKDAEQSMTVVGHVEQLHQSRCYQASGTLTCLTCHDPHDDSPAAERAGSTRTVCLSCHRLESCTVSVGQRRRESPGNDCVHCHMPRSATDIPHLAFTHHRIAVHRLPLGPSSAPRAQPGELQPFRACAGLSDVDRKRGLGEAYRLLSLRKRHANHKAEYEQRALDLLRAAEQAGLRDGDLEAALAQLCFDVKTGEPLAHAERALAFPLLAGQSRCDALFVKAQVHADRGEYANAIAGLRELTQLRRYAYDWLYLAKYARSAGDNATALDALQKAVEINPRQWDAQAFLADYYRQQGDVARAAWHQRRAVR